MSKSWKYFLPSADSVFVELFKNMDKIENHLQALDEQTEMSASSCYSKIQIKL